MQLPSFNPGYWLIQTVAMLLTVFLIPKLRVHGPFPAFLAVVSLAFINAHLWSTALFFSIPHSLTLQAGALLLANGLIFWAIAKVLPGIEVEGVLPAIAAPVVFTICSLVLNQLSAQVDWPQVWKTAQVYVSQTKDFVETDPAHQESGQTHENKDQIDWRSLLNRAKDSEGIKKLFGDSTGE
jgi:uncharacterized membrane protein YvlD (DUF360 family)